ncbi:hypothetical protein, conserved [Leishmania tarentolae]|uniref:Uncharacterized protein n=1 Tax=Leishmania tarentolae TaxID=5689 RepID=A0A640KTK1_LEITA|nr:hypothetical protein, conserved [Leishmania tarentolae]
MEWCVFDDTEELSMHEPQELSYANEKSSADRTASESEKPSYSSPGNNASTFDLEDTKEEGAAMSASDTTEEMSAESTFRTEEKTTVPASAPAIGGTDATGEAPVELSRKSLSEQEEAHPNEAEAEETHNEAAESFSYERSEERYSSDYNSSVTSEKRSTVASTPSAHDSIGEVRSCDVPVTQNCSSYRTHVSTASYRGPESARQSWGGKKDITCDPLNLTSDYTKAYALSLASSSLSSRQLPVHIPAPRQTPERSLRTKWSSPERGVRFVKHEMLPHITPCSKSRSSRRSRSTRANKRTAPKSVRKNASTSPSMLAVGHESNALSVKRPPATNAIVPTEATYLTMYSPGGSMKEVVSHVDRNSFGFHLRNMFQRIDFADVQREAQRGGRESADMQMCQRLFRVIAKGKDCMSVEDVHELLLIFTPCGVSLREGADFLWEKCEGKLSLTFSDFLEHGEVLRERLLDYERFEQLSDQKKLMVTHTRVLPDEPPADAGTARMNLLRVADQQKQDELSQHTRSLRLYEQIFLVDYHERLRDAALIPASELPRQELKSYDAHEYERPQNARSMPPLPQLSVPVLKEDMYWGPTEVEDSADRDANQAAVRAVEAEKGAAAAYDEKEYPALAGCSHSIVASKTSGKAANCSPTHRRRRQRGHGATESSSGFAGTSYRERNRLPGFDSTKGVVDRQRQLLPPPQKKMGRFVEEEYWERRVMDDHLMAQLQLMYKIQPEKHLVHRQA